VGKERSKRNATKYGIFSDVVLLAGESRSKYQSLLAEFDEYFRPPPQPTCLRIRRAPRLLAELRNTIQSRGLDKDKDAASLVEIYGFDPLKSPTGLFGVLEILSIVSKHPGSLAPELLNELQSELLNAEIQHFEELERSAKEAERYRADQQKKALRMLPPEKMELFLRYEVGLNREFDRILRRLEGLQRMRWGQPAPPEINLNVST